MADNVAITAGTGTTVAADEVTDGTLGSCKVQFVKLMDGTLDGTAKAAVGANGLAVDVKAAVISSGTITTVSTVSSVTAIANALPAGANAIGKLAANSGVDIGDVDVTTVGTITPGTAATSLGKAEDAAHSSGDTGIATWGVSNENLTAFGAASGDYAPIAVNRYGQKYVTAPPPTHISSNGTPITATTTTVIAAPSAGNHLRVVRIHMSNGGATATWLAVRDGAAGTRHYNTYLPQGGVISLNLNLSGPLDLTTATRLDIFLSAAGSVEYEIDYFTVAD